MAKVFIEETTLTAIGDAIRGKEGTTELIPTTDMATRITALPEGGGGGYEPTEEDLTLTGNCNYAFADGMWKWVLDQYGNKIKTVDINNLNYTFRSCHVEEIPFQINVNNLASASYAFSSMSNLKVCPKIRGTLTYGANLSELFQYSSSKLNDAEDLFTPEMFKPYQNFKLTSSYGGLGSVSNILPTGLRKIPTWWCAIRLNSESTAYPPTTYTIYNSLKNFYVVDEILNIPVWKCNAALTSNVFPVFYGSDGTRCFRLKNFTFETNPDGTPIEVQWKSQTIDLSYNTGYTTKSYETYILNSGISADKRVGNEVQYAQLKDDPDWYACNYTMDVYSIACSRYNKASAINTINSLPDASAYLATAGGTNTIKFLGTAGELTDGGKINTMTEEEIAVATAKGWTVTFV